MIFNELKASTVEAVQKEGNEPYHVIQKFIILNDIKGKLNLI